MTKTGACLVNMKSFSMYTLTYAKTSIIHAFMMILSTFFWEKRYIRFYGFLIKKLIDISYTYSSWKNNLRQNNILFCPKKSPFILIISFKRHYNISHEKIYSDSYDQLRYGCSLSWSMHEYCRTILYTGKWSFECGQGSRISFKHTYHFLYCDNWSFCPKNHQWKQPQKSCNNQLGIFNNYSCFAWHL